uniref:Uncharacterized protein n=1 Tax=Magallana gigas TaxID=29159 RepID=A0A8W8KBS8_MAGGI|eukprot:XP_011441417.1 PREDICTED: uncharacterized protein LOC105338122 isoform X1 [Crassostrea gigas]
MLLSEWKILNEPFIKPHIKMNGVKFISLVLSMHIINTAGIPVAHDVSLGNIYREPVNLNNDVVSCSRNMECGWLVCLWAQESNAEYGCQFFHNHCHCPSNLECSTASMSSPSDDHLVWDYRCQEPESNRK